MLCKLNVIFNITVTLTQNIR